MAMGLGRKKGGRRRSVAEINVTPLVDVMLVLLVIFMITAPTLKEGFSVEIPHADATQSVPVEEARMITITADGFVLKPNADTAEQRYDKLSQLVDDLKVIQIRTGDSEEAGDRCHRRRSKSSLRADHPGLECRANRWHSADQLPTGAGIARSKGMTHLRKR